ncbi:uncharacterized protein DUF1837 [Lacrimispora xylanisolvens]|uniref:Uncharacterized protein DUF1837 n=1 Tax=Lacrimispora xylanisolvens TaxID=384636 RepID=A0A2S6HHF1_9FIRM|nr:Hachiman antiphage defense system protein HamA [Hungatella xylanolytica]PPK76813.1 uncharacterized protein DUF1837 [Hungatella xylanolytica]
MNKNYRKIYDELITSQLKAVIIDYSPQTHNYIYRGYTHKAEATSMDDVVKLVIDDMIFYAFSESEVLELHEDLEILEDLREAAKYAYSQRLPKRLNADTDGTLGEVLLDIFIQAYAPNAEKLVIRAKHTEIKSKKEITGYDALYFTKENSDICIWLGQAKAGKKDYCKKSIVDDLNDKFKKNYFADTAFFIADKCDTEELKKMLRQINKICFEAQKFNYSSEKKINELVNYLNLNNVKIKIPCLIAYTKDIYANEEKLKEHIISEVEEIRKKFDDELFSIEVELPYEVVFYIFPIKDVNYLRKKIIELKREAI